MKIRYQKRRPNRNPTAATISLFNYTLLLSWCRVGRLHLVPKVTTLKGRVWTDFLSFDRPEHLKEKNR